MHQRPSRLLEVREKWAQLTSERRKPQPRSTAKMARSRKPSHGGDLGAAPQQRLRLPQREAGFRPGCLASFALFTRLMPAASSGASQGRCPLLPQPACELPTF